jgi:hypothetical protein
MTLTGVFKSLNNFLIKMRHFNLNKIESKSEEDEKKHNK